MPITTEPTLRLPVQDIINEHVNRYRMTVVSALRRTTKLRRFGHKRLAALLRQMCRDGQLGQATLYQGRRYFYAKSRDNGDSAKQLEPLKETAKIRNYALLAFCCFDQTPRQRLMASELETHFPAISRIGLPLNYYVDTSPRQPRLGFVRVDTGGRGRWDRILAKCREDLQAHKIHPGVKPFINRGAFEITLITALPHKARRLREEIASWNDPQAKLIRISVLPELLNLIAPPPTKN